MNSLIKPRSVLIFGGAGFIGSNWAHYLLTNTHAKVHVFDNLSRPQVEHNLRWLQVVANDADRLKITNADVRNTQAVDKAVFDASEIYHFAAQVAVTTSVENPRTDFEVNAGGTLNVLEAARRHGHNPFLLFTSTNKVYGKIESRDGEPPAIERQPTSESQPLDFFSPYGCSKGTADQYVHDYARIFGIPTVVFRMSCIAGPRQFGNEDQGWVAHFLYSALQGRPITIYGDGHQIRDVLAVNDLLRAFDAAYENRSKTAGQVYNIGGGATNAISLLELVRTMESLLKVKVNCRFRPARPGDQPVYVTDFSKFRSHCRWTPAATILQTMEEICSWYHEHEALFSPTHFQMPPPLTSDAVRGIAS